MFMHAGFALVETGLCRSKNAAHTISMNLMIYALGCLGFWAYGFAIGWGNWFNGPVAPGWYSTLGPGTSVLNSGIGIGRAVDASGAATGAYTYGLLGAKGFFLSGVDDVSVMALFFFMMVLMDTAATIPTGAMAERWSGKISASTDSGSPCHIASMPIGSGAEVGWLKPALIGNWGMAQSISPARALCTPWAESLRSPEPWF